MTKKLVSWDDVALALPAVVETHLGATTDTKIATQHTADSSTYVPQVNVSTAAPRAQMTQLFAGSLYANVEPTLYHAFNGWSIFQSEDITNTSGSAWTDKTLPSGVSGGAPAGFVKMVKFKGNYYMQAMASGVAGIYKAAPVANPGTFTWSSPVKTGVTGATIIMTGLACDASYLYWVEYGDPSGGPNLYRSADGTTWTKPLGPVLGARHLHGVFPDPYVPGQIWVTGGDTNPEMYVSPDYGITWAPVTGIVGTSQAYQCVQLSFTPNYVYAGSDASSWSAYRFDRATFTPKWVSPQFHGNIAVPGGAPGRRVTDLVTTGASATVTSATAAFTAADVGATIRTAGQDLIPMGSYIQSVTNSTTVVMTKVSTNTGSGLGATISGELFGQTAYYGAIDPTTGIYYAAALNGGVGGQVGGLFAIYPDGRMTLIETLTDSPDGNMTISGGYIYVRGFRRPTLSL